MVGERLQPRAITRDEDHCSAGSTICDETVIRTAKSEIAAKAFQICLQVPQLLPSLRVDCYDPATGAHAVDVVQEYIGTWVPCSVLLSVLLRRTSRRSTVGPHPRYPGIRVQHDVYRFVQATQCGSEVRCAFFVPEEPSTLENPVVWYAQQPCVAFNVFSVPASGIGDHGDNHRGVENRLQIVQDPPLPEVFQITHLLLLHISHSLSGTIGYVDLTRRREEVEWTSVTEIAPAVRTGAMEGAI